MTVGRVNSTTYISPSAPIMVMEDIIELKDRQLAKARKALRMCIAPDEEAERLKEEVLLEE
jgi:hypothetical protein